MSLSKELTNHSLPEIGDAFGGSDGGTSYSFASSNPMWRATLEILDFLPLSNVDYSGGIITTDWYNEGGAADESIKIKNKIYGDEHKVFHISRMLFGKILSKSAFIQKTLSWIDLNISIPKSHSKIFEKHFGMT